MKKAVIFDLDGTLVNTEPTYRAAWRKTFSLLGVDLLEDDLRSIMGLRPAEGAQMFLDRYSKIGDANALAESMLEHVHADPIRTLMPGAVYAIELALHTGHSVAVATGSPEMAAHASLIGAGLGDYFEIVCSTEHEPFGKPHPGVLLTTAARIGVDPLDCTVIEDAPNGLIAAKAARMQCVIVPEHGHRDHHAWVMADVLLDSLNDLNSEHFTAAH